MIEKLSKKIVLFYQISFAFIIFLSLGVLLYFWKLGFIDGSKGRDLHQASFIMENYESRQVLKEVKEQIINENPKLAIQKIKDVENELEFVNERVSSDSFEPVKASIQLLKKSSGKLISYSKVDKIVNVFSEKLDKFYNYVRENNWRTLTRMSDRIFTQVKGHINKNKLSSLVKVINRDFDTMLKVTANSILSRADKAEIKTRIESLKFEVQMIEKYSAERAAFLKQYKKTNSLISKWMQKLAPEVTMQKMEVEQMGRQYVMGLLSIALFSSVLFVLGFFVVNLFNRKNQILLEDKIESYINDQIIDGLPLEEEYFSKNFGSITQNISQYLHKRMSFGSIFQDAMPFSSLLLDANLKVQWANGQFCEDWCLSEEEMKKDYMSWDFLNKLTNLGHDDPVIEALKHGIAGIYQVQLKANDSTQTRPFEMFVSPVQYQNEKKVMLFFYDLSNLEETIREQASSLVTPVRKSLSQILDNSFNPDDKDLAYEFSIAEIDDILENFKAVSAMQANRESEFISHIEHLSAQIEMYKEKARSVVDKAEQSIQTARVSGQALKIFKENVIGLSELAKSLDKASIRSKEIIYANINALSSTVNKIDSSKMITKELMDVMPKFNLMKDDLRLCKTTLYEQKAKLGAELSSLKKIYSQKSGHSQSLDKVVERYSQFEKTVEDMDKKVSSLELLLSKVGMMAQTNEQKLAKIDSQYEKQQVAICEEEIQLLKKVTAGSRESIEVKEEHIVASLQEIFKATKSTIHLSTDMRGEFKDQISM